MSRINIMFLVTLCGTVASQSVVKQETLQFCPFFDNRAPRPEPQLKNCTWYQENSCCMQHEIEVMFAKVKPLIGSSMRCQRYLNYLMCYICSPDQGLFYRMQNLTVCSEFCEDLYQACGNSVLKGRVIKELYRDGTHFCKSRRFIVKDSQCFNFDTKFDAFSQSHIIRPSISLLCLMFLTFLLISTQNYCGLPTTSKRFGHKKIRRKSLQTIPSLDVNYIFALFLILLHNVTGVKTSMIKEVRSFSGFISERLKELAEKGLRYKEIQTIFDEAQYTEENVDGMNKLMKLKAKLGSFFSDKMAAAKLLANEVSALYDANLNSGNGDSKIPLQELNSTIYHDADMEYKMPENYFTYHKGFKKELILNQSVVKLPDEIDRDSPHLLSTIKWTAALDHIFKENMEQDADLRWQYFGSRDGMYRSYPGQEQSRNYIGFHDNYDPRTRPWYISATLGPKDIVIVIDASESMTSNNGMNKMKAVVTNVISTLSKVDFINVIVSRSTYYDKQGQIFEHNAEVLGCDNVRLDPATTIFRRELTQKVMTLEAKGGSRHIEAFQKAFKLLQSSDRSGCQSIILFVTDGMKTDLDQRCQPGYSKFNDNNKRTHVPGKKCQYTYKDLLIEIDEKQKQFPNDAIRILTVVTEEDPESDFPEIVSCRHGGLFVKVTSTSNIRHQMSLFYSWLESLNAGSKSAVWTDPYLDTGGLGLTVTAAIPVYSNTTHEHLGVVGVDATLETIQNLLHNEHWGDAYFFLVDNQGSAMIHPLVKTSAQVVDDPVYIGLWNLETHNGEPDQFQDVFQSIVNRNSGYFSINEGALKAVSFHNALVWISTDESLYYYTPIDGSEYVLGLKTTSSDVIYQYNKEPTTYRSTYISDIDGYLNTKGSSLIPDVQHIFNITNLDPKYNGNRISKAVSTVALSPRAFCDSVTYLEDNVPSLLAIHNHINSPNITIDGCNLAGALLRRGIRASVKLTSQAELLWKERQANLQNEVAWTYIGMRSGIMRIYPGVQLSRDYEPASRPWYNRAILNCGKLAISSVYADASGLGKVMTISTCIHQGKRSGNCSDSVIVQEGCPCNKSIDCKSQLCYNETCASNTIEGVTGLDIHYTDFHDNIMSLASGGLCNGVYTCRDSEHCQTRCYIIDDESNLVMDSSFYNMSDNDVELYTKISIAGVQGFVFKQLLHAGIYKRIIRHDYQATCKHTVNTEVHHVMNQSEDKTDVGPFPPFQNKYGCIQSVQFYHIQSEKFVTKESIITGSLEHSPCEDGWFYFSNIPDTNLYLLVLENYTQSQKPFNFNCHITNSVYKPGSYKITEETCVDTNNANYSVPLPSCHGLNTVHVHCSRISGSQRTIARSTLWFVVLTAILVLSSSA